MHAGSQARTTIQGELSCLCPEATAYYCGSGYFLEHIGTQKLTIFGSGVGKLFAKQFKAEHLSQFRDPALQKLLIGTFFLLFRGVVNGHFFTN
jgi:hypothetical protein